jgi:hypothetical protein
MERRLSKPPLAKPRIAFVREQAIPEKPMLRAECPCLDESAAIPDENRFDEARVADEDGTCTTKPETRNRTVLTRGASHKLQGVTRKIRQVPRQQPSAGSAVRNFFHQVPSAVRSWIGAVRRSG